MSEGFNKYSSAFDSSAPRNKEEPPIDDTQKFLQKIRRFKPKFAVYNTIMVTGLESIRLAKNTTFETLKEEIISFNAQVKEALVTKKEIQDYGFKSALLDGVRNRLREICETENNDLQLVLLDRTTKWYESQLARKEGADARSASVGTKRNGSVEKDKENPALGKSFILPPKSKRDPLPSEFREIILRDYEQGNRTLQGDTTPPYQKIKDYERKLPVIQQNAPKAEGTQISVSMPDRRSTSPYRHYDPSFQGSKTQFSPDVSPMRKNAPNQEWPDKETEEKPKVAEEHTKTIELVKTDQPAKTDQPEKIEEGKEQDEVEDGKEGEDDENQAPPMVKFDERKVFTEDRKVGMVYLQTDQLVPIEKRSNYVYHQPKGDITELDLERRYRDYLHKRLMVKREQEEMVTMMDEWAHAKSRIDEDISRRNESSRFASHFERRGWSLESRSSVKAGVYKPDNSQLHPYGTRSVLPGSVHQEERVLSRNKIDLSKIETPQEISTTRESIMNQVRVVIYKEERKEAGEIQHQPKLINYSAGKVLNSQNGEERRGRTQSVERDAGKRKIARIRELHGSMISATETTMVEQNEEEPRGPAMSIYDPMHNIHSGYRRLSETLSRLDGARMINQSINEIDAIKKKAAQAEIPIQMKALTTSLLIPTPISKTKLRPLPQPGRALMANPFVKERKKKGRK